MKEHYERTKTSSDTMRDIAKQRREMELIAHEEKIKAIWTERSASMWEDSLTPSSPTVSTTATTIAGMTTTPTGYKISTPNGVRLDVESVEKAVLLLHKVGIEQEELPAMVEIYLRAKKRMEEA